jgi:hypothetical protein
MFYRLIYDRYGNTVGIVKRLGPQEFDLPQNVIDIIYSQTLCWYVTVLFAAHLSKII